MLRDRCLRLCDGVCRSGGRRPASESCDDASDDHKTKYAKRDTPHVRILVELVAGIYSAPSLIFPYYSMAHGYAPPSLFGEALCCRP